ncbi:chymotrypsin-2-like [Cimex lectularius]|uniref:Peptidase S1 domain-containing protein n=1 Tax=Cimex lectularius TaxID=79782 RepID=A0A8I6SQK2_CIMLE|nr:chymotrypsin-2-like [Cimex lectularius]
MEHVICRTKSEKIFNMLFYLLISVFIVVYASESEKLFGGRYAKDGEFPFVVSIRGKSSCAGSLVTLSKVVTAAHCLALFLNMEGRSIDVNELYVVGGSVDLEKFNEGIDVRAINSILVTGEYKAGTRFGGKIDSHDIGMAVLDYPFKSGKNLQVMNLVSWNATIFKNSWDEIVAKRTICYAMGWGTTTYHPDSMGKETIPAEPSLILKVIQVRPSDNESCSLLFSRKDDLTMYGEICVYSVKKHETICDGDSGGPLVCDGRPYALLNYGPRCGTTLSPQGYLLFWYYMDFLTLSGNHLFISKWLILLILLLYILCNYI